MWHLSSSQMRKIIIGLDISYEPFYLSLLVLATKVETHEIGKATFQISSKFMQVAPRAPDFVRRLPVILLLLINYGSMETIL